MFTSFPEHAQLWIFVSNRTLTSQERDQLLQHVRTFLSTWKTHGRPVAAEAAWVEQRFLLVAGYIPDDQISGCGIDAMTRAVEAIGHAMDISWLPGLMIHYRDSKGDIHSVSRSTFRRLLQEGHIQPETPVFNHALNRLKALREGRFEEPLYRSPFARIFRVPAPPAST